MMIPFRAFGNLFREGVLSRLVGSSSSVSPVFGRGAFISPHVTTAQAQGQVSGTSGGGGGWQCQGQRQYHTTRTTGSSSLSPSASSLPALTVGGGPSMMMGPSSWSSIRFNSSVKTFQGKVRIYFPRPRDTKRIQVHGWKRRMETPSQRSIIMRRILKGKHILSHDP